MTLSYDLAYLETILVHPTKRQNFANTVQPHRLQDLTPCPIESNILALWCSHFTHHDNFTFLTVDFRLQQVIHIWKAMTLSYDLAYQ